MRSISLLSNKIFLRLSLSNRLLPNVHQDNIWDKVGENPGFIFLIYKVWWLMSWEVKRRLSFLNWFSCQRLTKADRRHGCIGSQNLSKVFIQTKIEWLPSDCGGWGPRCPAPCRCPRCRWSRSRCSCPRRTCRGSADMCWDSSEISQVLIDPSWGLSVSSFQPIKLLDLSWDGCSLFKKSIELLSHIRFWPDRGHH